MMKIIYAMLFQVSNNNSRVVEAGVFPHLQYNIAAGGVAASYNSPLGLFPARKHICQHNQHFLSELTELFPPTAQFLY